MLGRVWAWLLSIVMGRRFAALNTTTAFPYPVVASPFAVNTSASSSYNAAGIPANFTGSAKQDKSLNYEAGNVFASSIHELLYSGHTTKVYAVGTSWWGLSSHISNGTTSNDATQAQRIIAELVRRGIDGWVPSWYGYGRDADLTAIDEASQKQLAECNSQGIKFAMLMDALAIDVADPTAEMLLCLTHANTYYFGNSAYLKIGGRPVFLVFGEPSGVDWAAVRTHADTHGNPLFLFRNTPGFTHTESNGAFAWVDPDADTGPDPAGIGYLDDYYAYALTTSGKEYFGSIYAGFNDTLASWGSGRSIAQRDGQTLLDTIAAIPANGFSSSQQLSYVLMAAWEDYEEGTEFETGFTSGVTFSPSYAAGHLTWTITAGNENAIKRYDVYSTPDSGTTYYRLGTVAVGATYDLAIIGLPSGSHKLYVVGQGKFSIRTAVSSAVNITI